MLIRLLLCLLALGALYGIGTRVAPPVIEAGINRVLNPPPYPVSIQASALHQKLLVADMHADSLLWSRDLLARSDRGHVDIPRLIEGNVGLQAFTIVSKSPRGQNIDRNPSDSDRITDLVIASAWPLRTWGSLFERALFQIQKLRDFAQRSEGKLRLIESRQDLDAYLAAYKPGDPSVGAWLGIEGAHPLEGQLDKLDRLFAAGLRMAGITHFFDNELGGSMHGMNQAGLTDFGRAAVARMQELGVLVDLAHASSAVVDDVLAMASQPVVVSHGGVKGTCDNNRNLSDAQVRGIAATGGLIAIGYWDKAVCGDDARAIAKAIRYTAELVGVAHVALGSDFDGAVTVPFDTTGIPRITEALMKEGFSPQEIAQIAGLNVVRVLRASLPDSAP